jgi:hypothetical protein
MPFVSYGGSSMLFSMISLGALMNLSRHVDASFEPPSPARGAGSVQETLRPGSGTIRAASVGGRPAWR